MGKSTFEQKRNRIDCLIGLLKSHDDFNTSALAKKLGVSHRTIMRDLAYLSETGIPLESDRGRGGGVRINAQWGLGKLRLSYRESLDLILALATMEKLKSTLFLNDLKSIRAKISQSFPEEQRKQLSRIRKRVLIADKPAHSTPISIQNHNENNKKLIQQAFFEMQKIQIIYADQKQNVSQRVIEPHYLLLNWPIWYIQAWDYLRNDVRFFRIDRINEVKILNDRFKIHSCHKFKLEVCNFFESV